MCMLEFMCQWWRGWGIKYVLDPLVIVKCFWTHFHGRGGGCNTFFTHLAELLAPPIINGP